MPLVNECVSDHASLSLPATEKATNPKNKYEDWEFIMAFCDRVNAEAEGCVARTSIASKSKHPRPLASL